MGLPTRPSLSIAGGPSEHTEVPLDGIALSSGSRVKLPVMITRLMLLPAIEAPFLKPLKIVSESMPGPGGILGTQRKMVRNVAVRGYCGRAALQFDDKDQLSALDPGRSERPGRPGPTATARTNRTSGV